VQLPIILQVNIAMRIMGLRGIVVIPIGFIREGSINSLGSHD